MPRTRPLMLIISTIRTVTPQELAQELGEAPEELGGDEGNMSSAFAKREFARMEARAKIEEDLFTRVPLSKVERRRQKATTRSMNSLAEVGDFGDDVADLVDVVEELETRKKQRLVDVVSMGANPKHQKPSSGDQDVPLRDSLGVSSRATKSDVFFFVCFSTLLLHEAAAEVVLHSSGLDFLHYSKRR